MSRYRDQVAAALEAVRILSPTRYAWLGRASRALPASVDAEMGDDERRRYLVGCLRQELYASFYCCGRPVPARWGRAEPPIADPALVAAISAVNRAPGGWEAGWTVERVENDAVIVSSSRLRVRASPADCRANGPVCPGATVSLRLPNELRALSPGFYTVVGGDPIEYMPAGLVRVYWNVSTRSAPALVHALTTRLDAQRTPFRLKVADHPMGLERCDAAVLYLAADDFRQVRATLRSIAGELATGLGRSIPALTLELAPGVGLAEDGEATESFGTRRCALLAEGLVVAHRDGIVEPPARLAAVLTHLRRGGVDIDAPYREPVLAGRHVL